MPVFIELTDANVTDASFWAGLTVDQDSTIDASNISDDFQITMTSNGITFTDTSTGTTTSYTDSDLAGGSFSEFVQFYGNDGNSNVSGTVGLNAQGYNGGDGDDTLTDDGNLGGRIDGEGGDDVLQGGTGNNNIFGGQGDDVLRGGGGSNNILLGGDGDDTLFAEDGGGNLEGGSGDDVIVAGLNTGFVQGGTGTDSLTVPEGSVVEPFSPTGGNVILPNGNRFTYLNIETVTVACFTAGTPLRTPHGDVAVDMLNVGDLILTADHGACPIRWIGKRTVPGRGALAPIVFLPGSIGNDAKLRLSPQHRVLLSGWKCELIFETPEVLCAAKHLCDGDQIFTEPCTEVTYYHVMFDQHEVVFAHGALLESFYTGDHILDADQDIHAELTALFPELAQSNSARAARPFVKGYEARALLPL
ncbi:Hint domain-containing protein [Roseobacter sp.]|uniref:Hint domain-containing protein n=1 Tax=Roseobacter sp. TaxID=1907202 RepID=UPI003299A0D8